VTFAALSPPACNASVCGAEAVLNHISGSRVGIAGVCQQHNWAAEKRAALEAWAAHVVALIEGLAVPSRIVSLVQSS
jgi:hypothetical protein